MRFIAWFAATRLQRSSVLHRPRVENAVTGETATLMIGNDDETWDISVALPLGLVDEIARRAADRL